MDSCRFPSCVCGFRGLGHRADSPGRLFNSLILLNEFRSSLGSIAPASTPGASAGLQNVRARSNSRRARPAQAQVQAPSALVLFERQSGQSKAELDTLCIPSLDVAKAISWALTILVIATRVSA